MSADNFSFTLTVASDYAYRGTSPTEGGATAQGSVDWAYKGFFTGVWASNIAKSFGVGSTVEVDYYAGWAGSVGGLEVELMPLLYLYPGQDSGTDWTTFEMNTGLSWGAEGMMGSPAVSLGFAWSPDFTELGTAWYLRPAIGFSLPADVALDIAYGYQDIEDSTSYGHYEVTLSKQVVGLDLALSWHDNSKPRQLGQEVALDGEFIFSVSRSF